MKRFSLLVLLILAACGQDITAPEPHDLVMRAPPDRLMMAASSRGRAHLTVTPANPSPGDRVTIRAFDADGTALSGRWRASHFGSTCQPGVRDTGEITARLGRCDYGYGKSLGSRTVNPQVTMSFNFPDNLCRPEIDWTWNGKVWWTTPAKCWSVYVTHSTLTTRESRSHRLTVYIQATTTTEDPDADVPPHVFRCR